MSAWRLLGRRARATGGLALALLQVANLRLCPAADAPALDCCC